MIEYTPTTGPMRDAWRHDRERHTGAIRPRVYGAEFDRWLAAHDAAVQAEAQADISAFANALTLHKEKLAEQAATIEAAKSAYDPFAHDGADAEIMYAILYSTTTPQKETTP